MTTKNERIVRARLMPDGRVRRVRADRKPGRVLPGQADWRRLDTVTPPAARAASLADPDAPPLTARQLKEFKPVQPPKRVDVARVRRRLRMSQAAFAARFGLDVTAVHAWEQGRRRPDRAARVLLAVIDREPEAVLRALASGPALPQK